MHFPSLLDQRSLKCIADLALLTLAQMVVELALFDFLASHHWLL